jgi:EpsD family peptidyl-prolyl cis-trans isomerase
MAASRAKVLETLVSQQLAIAQAEQMKLDRLPGIVASVDAARREILARAYFEQIAATQSTPSEPEIRQYYDSHPELFSERRLYSLKEVTTEASPEIVSYSRDFAASGKPIEAYMQWLGQRGTRYAVANVTRAPETLPLSLVPRLAQAKDGSVVTATTDAGVYVAQVVGSHPAPLREPQAAPDIRRFIQNQRALDALAHEIARLRAQTKIEYMGEFADLAKGSGAAPPVAQPAADGAPATTMPSGSTAPAATKSQ